VRQVGGDLETRLTKLVADWPAGRREAADEAHAELVGTIGANIGARDEASDG
jgi:hypothetical protein